MAPAPKVRAAGRVAVARARPSDVDRKAARRVEATPAMSVFSYTISPRRDDRGCIEIQLKVPRARNGLEFGNWVDSTVARELPRLLDQLNRLIDDEPREPRTEFVLCIPEEDGDKVTIAILKPEHTKAATTFAADVDWDNELQEALEDYVADLNGRLAEEGRS